MDDRTMARRTIQLRHDLPDGSHHIDWLLAQDADASRPLLSWRLDRRVDELIVGESAKARRLPDHRSIYLDYEGPISGGRGKVRRLIEGSAIMRSEHPIDFELRWPHEQTFLTQRLSIVRHSGDNWIVTCTQRSQCSPFPACP